MSQPIDADEVFASIGGAVPLLSIAHDRIGQDVAVHVIGGISVDGRLVSVNDDDETITVVDKDRRYDIALGSVAVIEGSQS